MRVGVVINELAAQAQTQPDLEKTLRELFAAEGVQVEFVPLQALEEGARQRGTGRLDALVGGGGDGTMSAVAQIALANRLPLGVLPLGTRNHFARDLKIPGTAHEAVKIIANGRTTRIDIGEVNGRVFLNNSSIGAYPRAVEEREVLRREHRIPKKLAMVFAVLKVFAESRLLWANIRLDDCCVRAVSSFVFVGNNRYELKNISSQFRSSLNEGLLTVFTAVCHGLREFMHMMWLTLRGTIEQSGLLHGYYSKTAVIELKRPQVRVSTDGEIWQARTPLKYSIRPQALEVFT